MKPGWTELAFGEACRDVSSLGGKVPKTKWLSSGTLPVIDQGDSASASYTDDLSAAFRGDLPVIVFGDHTRRFKFIDHPFAIGADGVKVLAASSTLDPRYLFWYLSSIAIPSAGYSRHFKFLRDARIPLPKLDEQQYIARVLDAADAVRKMRRRSVDTATPFEAALFRDMFGKPGPRDVTTLGAVSDVTSGITKGRRINGQKLIEVPYLAVSNVQDGHLDMRHVKTIEASVPEITRFRLAPGDLLLTEGGDPDKVGRGTLWSGELELCIHQNHIFRVRVTDPTRLDPVFMRAQVASPAARSFFLRAAKQTTGIASINRTQLRALPLYLPSITLQREFVERLRAADSARDSRTRHLAELDALIASLQHRAFTGAL